MSHFFAITTLVCAIWLQQSRAWVSPIPSQHSARTATASRSSAFTHLPTSYINRITPTCSQLYSTETDTAVAAATSDEVEDDDDEYEYIEYENLAESDFLGSEWGLGTCWDNKKSKIDDTWARLIAKGDKNQAVWGDDSEGTWSFDVASQFLTISKNYFWGKKIWAGVVDDYYFLQGTVRGWTYFTAASVEGQWQARRLGVDPEEAGTAPWFLVEEDEDEDGAAEETPTTMDASTAVEEKKEEKVEVEDNDEEEEEPSEVKAAKDDSNEETTNASEPCAKTDDDKDTPKEEESSTKKVDDDADKKSDEKS